MHGIAEPDNTFMHSALHLAKKVKGTTFPNPAVGAVVVLRNEIVGKGATEECGGAHAEKVALKKAGIRAKGATMYVTLEPCSHFGRTSPCTQAIADAGIKKGFISVKDSNPLVNGKGIRFLRRRNISVSVGLLREEAIELNEDFFWAITHRKPWITLKLALTLDGKIADTFGNSKWITNKKSRAFVHDIRRCHAAVAVGKGTLLKDDPQLTVRHVQGKSPARIVFSSEESVALKSHFRMQAKKYRSIIVCGGGTKGEKRIAPDGVEIWYAGYKKSSRILETFLQMAFDDGLTSILVEGGQKLASSFLECKLVNRLYIFYGNNLIGGGLDGFSFSKGLAIERGLYLSKVKTACFGDTIMITGIPGREQ